MDRLRYDEDSAFTLADDAATLARIVRTVAADRLRAARFGEWTAVEVIGHLADSAEIFAERVRRCIEEDRPALPSFDQDEIAKERRNAERDPMDLSRRVSAAHASIVRLLTDERARSRPGIHSEHGELDAGHFGAYQARHGHEHAVELATAFPPKN
ncbi:MAG TPA: DinB family protein [Candidatus Limnocylindria bacterium]|nr:DinB family protein [Candidatus Limnocylindria bacterium]